jgi:ADP-ribose pyrophosphatase YjhB (NUDIX family)
VDASDTEATELLEHSVNRYRAVLPDPHRLPTDPDRFAGRLRRSLEVWGEVGHRSVLLEIPRERAALIPVAVAEGFTFHHSNPDELLLLRPLVAEGVYVPSAMHTVGAGGVVINDRDEVLVVWEASHLDRPQDYKLPGGFVDPGYHIAAGVEREVREETGVESRFEAVVGVRQWHRNMFGTSNLYFICRLTPLSEALHTDDPEIHDVRWMPVADYVASEFVNPFNKRMVELARRGGGLAQIWIDGYRRSPEEIELLF